MTLYWGGILLSVRLKLRMLLLSIQSFCWKIAANIPIFTLKKIEIMQKIRIMLLFCFFGQFVFAQTVQVQVDILAKRKKVSPYIYGRNNSLSNFNNTPFTTMQWQFLRDAGVTMFRESGGNNSTKYNWRRKFRKSGENQRCKLQWLEPISDADIQVFPNPSNGGFNVKTGVETTVSVYNFVGQLMGTYPKGTQNFGKDWSNGSYVAVFSIDNQVVKMVKLVKE